MNHPEPTTGDKAAAQQTKLKELHDQLDAQVTALTEGADWKAWLAVAARFRSYSWHNTMLILAQRPEATRVAGYREWQRLGRQVTKGEKGIKIIAPTFRRQEHDDDPIQPETVARDDADNGADHKREPSRAKKLVGYTVVHVWDESQTTGDPLPEAPTPQLLQGAAPDGLWDELATLVAATGFTLERGDCGGPDGNGGAQREPGHREGLQPLIDSSIDQFVGQPVQGERSTAPRRPPTPGKVRPDNGVLRSQHVHDGAVVSVDPPTGPMGKQQPGPIPKHHAPKTRNRQCLFRHGRNAKTSHQCESQQAEPTRHHPTTPQARDTSHRSL